MHSSLSLSQILSLQRLEKPFTDRGEWLESVTEEPCRQRIRKDLFSPLDFNVKVKSCLTTQGRTSVIIPELHKRAHKSRSVCPFYYIF